MVDPDAALVPQFLNITEAERETVIQPDGVLDDGHRESMPVGLEVGQRWSAYPGSVKATPPKAPAECGGRGPKTLPQGIAADRWARGAFITPSLMHPSGWGARSVRAE